MSDFTASFRPKIYGLHEGIQSDQKLVEANHEKTLIFIHNCDRTGSAPDSTFTKKCRTGRRLEAQSWPVLHSHAIQYRHGPTSILFVLVLIVVLIVLIVIVVIVVFVVIILVIILVVHVIIVIFFFVVLVLLIFRSDGLIVLV